MNNEFSPIEQFTLIGFIKAHGIPAKQPKKNGKIMLAFTNPITGKDTLVSISDKLKDEDIEALIKNELDHPFNQTLTISQTEVPEEIMEERQKRAEEGEDVQMESYVLHRKGQGTRVALNIDWTKYL